MLSYRLALATLVAFAVVATPAAAQEPPPWLKLQDGVTAPQFALADAIEEVVFVESTLDTDGDGNRDRIRIRISRPAETESQGIDVPVVFEHSPYRGDFGNAVNHNVDFEVMPQEGRDHKRASAARARLRSRARADLPGQLDNYYVPRGYAVVLGESIGTFNSDGCPDVGGPWETLGTKAVIDWLNGRAPDRPRRRLDRPRLHDPPAAGNRAHARARGERARAAARRRCVRARLLATIIGSGRLAQLVRAPAR